MIALLPMRERSFELSPEPFHSYTLARSWAQRKGAYQLVYESYLESGLGTTNRHEMRVTPYHLRPSTQIFVGTEDREVMSTVTLVQDDGGGLPLEAMYPLEIARLRAQGVALAEVSCLADRRKDPRRFLPEFCKLMRVMAQFAKGQGVDQLLVAVHPRHARFYARYLGFEQVGGLTNCGYVQDRPALAMCFQFEKFEREQPPSYTNIFGELIPAEELQPYTISDHERELLAAVAAAGYLPSESDHRETPRAAVDRLASFDARTEQLGPALLAG